MYKILQTFFIWLVLQSLFYTNSAVSQTVPDWSQPLQPCWQFSTAEMSVLPAFSDDKLATFLPLSDGSIVALETASGKILWRSEFGGEIIAPPLLSEGKIFLLSRVSDDGGEQYIFRAVSSNSGLTVLQKKPNLNNSLKASVLANENFVYIFAAEGNVLAFDKTSGNQVWEKFLPAHITSVPFVGEKEIYIGSEDKKISVLSAADGTSFNVFQMENPAAGDLQFSSGMLFFGDQIGNISAIRVSDGKLLWKFRTGASIVDIAFVNDNLLAASNDGFVYMLTQKSGDRVWKHRLAGRFIGKVLLNHRFLLVQTLDSNLVPVLDSTKGKVVNQIRLTPESFTVNGAAGGDELLVIPTNKGLQAFANRCQNQ